MRIITFLLFSLLVGSCALFQKKDHSSDRIYTSLPTVEVHGNENTEYRAAKTKKFKLIHTKLWVDFDWSKQRMNGKAELSLHPYFYESSVLDLDAKGFDIHSVERKDSLGLQKLKYTYDSLQLHIQLGKTYTNKDTCVLIIQYTSKPEEFKAGGSEAIESDKGLYFINADGSENKPKQIWTQGETEASSRWFPTLDAPNQKMTQELWITVDKKYMTLSNGVLQYSSENEDGTRTDYWKQDKPHAPYLAMMAVGEFSVIKDEWTKKSGQIIPVHYIVEKEYEPFAQQIFGNTPEMLTFFSNKTGVEFPWDKYDQIVVRDYVSGAMENTTAVIFGEFMQQTDREMLDQSFESIIAHELFHHWFGDLVTSESWSNLPLNESFANYSEYLWDEYKYGLDEAGYNQNNNWNQYLSESKNKQVPLIRYQYRAQEDMFDRHSYEKGGCILHMLRKYVGDDAFFKSLHYYLTQNAYQSAEIDHLRLAFEQVTGEDLHWFFNQWFFQPGHPNLKISYAYDSLKKTQYIYTEQSYSLAGQSLIYKIPVTIDLYTKDRVLTKNITLKNERDTFLIEVSQKPDFVNFDATKSIAATKNETKSAQEWMAQYHRAPLFLDRQEALINLVANHKEEEYAPVVLACLEDKHWNLRQTALVILERVQKEKIAQKAITKIILNDSKSEVRYTAISILHELYLDSISIDFYKSLLDDPSYLVVSEAMNTIYAKNKEQGVETAKMYESEKNETIEQTVLHIYALEGVEGKNDLFLSKIKSSEGYEKASYIMNYQKYILHEKVLEKYFDQGISLFEQEILGNDENQIKLYSIVALKASKVQLEKLISKKTASEIVYKEKLEKLNSLLANLRNTVQDEELKLYLSDQ